MPLPLLLPPNRCASMHREKWVEQGVSCPWPPWLPPPRILARVAMVLLCTATGVGTCRRRDALTPIPPRVRRPLQRRLQRQLQIPPTRRRRRPTSTLPRRCHRLRRRRGRTCSSRSCWSHRSQDRRRPLRYVLLRIPPKPSPLANPIRRRMIQQHRAAPPPLKGGPTKRTKLPTHWRG